MAKNFHDITLALAGVCQSTRLVQQLAHQGHCDHDAFQVSLSSVLDLNPASTLAVYGNDIANLHEGLTSLVAVLTLSSRQWRYDELMRYLLNLMVIERKLSNNKALVTQLASRIDSLQRQLAHYSLESDNMINALAGIYLDIISPISPRIQVKGSQSLLESLPIQAKVRAALLAGIRASVLWRQVGGGRLQLLFSRHRLIDQAKQFLARHEEFK